MNSTFSINDRVAYRASFLRSVGDYSGYSASRRGTVIELTSPSFVLVRWADGMDSCCNTENLIHADRIHLEPA